MSRSPRLPRAPRNPEFVAAAEARRATFTALVEAQRTGLGLETAERDHARTTKAYEAAEREDRLRRSTVTTLRGLSIRSAVSL